MGSWIDGAPIYKKTISFGSLPNATSKSVNLGVNNLNRVISVEAWAYRSNNSTWVEIPYTSPAGNSNIGFTINGQTITLITSTDRTDFTESYFTIYYIKS